MERNLRTKAEVSGLNPGPEFGQVRNISWICSLSGQNVSEQMQGFGW
jgi:hypothetical protein